MGCLIIEMLTGQHPFPDLTQMQAIFRVRQSTSAHIQSR
jgi:mitogen-activated protein kinase kinase kinase